MPHSLRAKLSGLRYKGILEDKDYKRLCHALDLEKAEQEQKSGKWIPVGERLPEENEMVLINYCRLNEHSVRMAIWDELHCRFYNSEYTKYVSVDFVTAWMPLPKPYEPQESEERNDKRKSPNYGS